MSVTSARRESRSRTRASNRSDEGGSATALSFAVSSPVLVFVDALSESCISSIFSDLPPSVVSFVASVCNINYLVLARIECSHAVGRDHERPLLACQKYYHIARCFVRWEIGRLICRPPRPWVSHCFCSFCSSSFWCLLGSCQLDCGEMTFKKVQSKDAGGLPSGILLKLP